MGVYTYVCLGEMGHLNKRGFWNLKQSENSFVGDGNSIPLCCKSDLTLDVLVSVVSQPTELWVIILSQAVP